MNKHIFIIAGEASGDEHAAKLIKELNSHSPNYFTFTGIGGTHMSQAGATVLYPLAQYGVTGFTEIFKQFNHIYTAYQQAKTYVINHKIDLLILVDYPGFNLRFAKLAKKHNIKILYYISPQIWAWKAKRIHIIKKYIDVMAVILPFEKSIYQKAGVPAFFVGNPLTETVKVTASIETLKNKYTLSVDKKLIGILPGSRNNEIKQLLPIMLQAAQELDKTHPNQLQFVLPLASSITPLSIRPFLTGIHFDLNVIYEHDSSIEIMACCQSIMVASGTASLQAALLYKPMVIIYKTSFVTYLIASQVMKCAYIGLVNLLANKMLVPELIQSDLTSVHLAREINRYISDWKYNHKVEQELKKISKMLENKSVDCKLEHLVFDLIEQDKVSIKDVSKSK